MYCKFYIYFTIIFIIFHNTIIITLDIFKNQSRKIDTFYNICVSICAIAYKTICRYMMKSSVGSNVTKITRYCDLVIFSCHVMITLLFNICSNVRLTALII